MQDRWLALVYVAAVVLASAATGGIAYAVLMAVRVVGERRRRSRLL